jgi:hypothetical protein
MRQAASSVCCSGLIPVDGRGLAENMNVKLTVKIVHALNPWHNDARYIEVLKNLGCLSKFGGAGPMKVKIFAQQSVEARLAIRNSVFPRVDTR